MIDPFAQEPAHISRLYLYPIEMIGLYGFSFKSTKADPIGTFIAITYFDRAKS